MKISTRKLKKELSKRKEVLQDHLTLRLHEILYWVIHEEFEEENEIHILDLIVRVILQADKGPAESIADLISPLTNNQCFDLEKRTISNSAAFIRDYLKKDLIHFVLKRRFPATRKTRSML
ncbi:MAG: hypothetical protein OXB84_02090 [Halobacteriovoraceae bacterium]|nr:hypothetical protein [Halobacteriovoraceae bacterium]